VGDNLSAVTGILKGYDQLLNLVLDEVEEEASGKSLINDVRFSSEKLTIG
jgi:small nuclear ribonucleoprotein (snRNP)-like protein